MRCLLVSIFLRLYLSISGEVDPWGGDRDVLIEANVADTIDDSVAYLYPQDKHNSIEFDSETLPVHGELEQHLFRSIVVESWVTNPG